MKSYHGHLDLKRLTEIRSLLLLSDVLTVKVFPEIQVLAVHPAVSFDFRF